jgi:hypothetical protein
LRYDLNETVASIERVPDEQYPRSGASITTLSTELAGTDDVFVAGGERLSPPRAPAG